MLNEARARAGRLGYQAVLRKYGPEFFAIMGQRGGRPRTATATDIWLATAPVGENDKRKEGEERLPRGLRALKTLYKFHMGRA